MLRRLGFFGDAQFRSEGEKSFLMKTKSSCPEAVPVKPIYSVAEFTCQHGISRALFYKLLQAGNGPRIMKVGKRLSSRMRQPRSGVGAGRRWREDKKEKGDTVGAQIALAREGSNAKHQEIHIA